MDNEIMMYTAGYLAARLAVLGLFGFALYQVLRPTPALVRVPARRTAPGTIGHATHDPVANARARSVRDDRC